MDEAPPLPLPAPYPMVSPGPSWWRPPAPPPPHSPQVFYRSNPAREAFVEMCESNYVQKMTFDSYLYKTGAPACRMARGGG